MITGDAQQRGVLVEVDAVRGEERGVGAGGKGGEKWREVRAERDGRRRERGGRRGGGGRVGKEGWERKSGGGRVGEKGWGRRERGGRVGEEGGKNAACKNTYESKEEYLHAAHSTVQRKTFKGENFCEFRGFVAICASFSLQNLGCGVLWHGKSKQSVKIIFSPIRESFLLRKIFAIQYPSTHQKMLALAAPLLSSRSWTCVLVSYTLIKVPYRETSHDRLTPIH